MPAVSAGPGRDLGAPPGLRCADHIPANCHACFSSQDEDCRAARDTGHASAGGGSGVGEQGSGARRRLPGPAVSGRQLGRPLSGRRRRRPEGARVGCTQQAVHTGAARASVLTYMLRCPFHVRRFSFRVRCPPCARTAGTPRGSGTAGMPGDSAAGAQCLGSVLERVIHTVPTGAACHHVEHGPGVTSAVKRGKNAGSFCC